MHILIYIDIEISSVACFNIKYQKTCDTKNKSLYVNSKLWKFHEDIY